jgi:hypothetical protein
VQHIIKKQEIELFLSRLSPNLKMVSAADIPQGLINDITVCTVSLAGERFINLLCAVVS